MYTSQYLFPYFPNINIHKSAQPSTRQGLLTLALSSSYTSLAFPFIVSVSIHPIHFTQTPFMMNDAHRCTYGPERTSTKEHGLTVVPTFTTRELYCTLTRAAFEFSPYLSSFLIEVHVVSGWPNVRRSVIAESLVTKLEVEVRSGGDKSLCDKGKKSKIINLARVGATTL